MSEPPALCNIKPTAHEHTILLIIISALFNLTELSLAGPRFRTCSQAPHFRHKAPRGCGPPVISSLLSFIAGYLLNMCTALCIQVVL
uniref:Uncharacterized protein n=1 Tax=Xenopus tropicalis TaxID=8364 RepID=A0A1B8XWE4_XENTR